MMEVLSYVRILITMISSNMTFYFRGIILAHKKVSVQ